MAWDNYDDDYQEDDDHMPSNQFQNDQADAAANSAGLNQYQREQFRRELRTITTV